MCTHREGAVERNPNPRRRPVIQIVTRLRSHPWIHLLVHDPPTMFSNFLLLQGVCFLLIVTCVFFCFVFVLALAPRSPVTVADRSPQFHRPLRRDHTRTHSHIANDSTGSGEVSTSRQERREGTVALAATPTDGGDRPIRRHSGRLRLMGHSTATPMAAVATAPDTLDGAAAARRSPRLRLGVAARPVTGAVSHSASQRRAASWSQRRSTWITQPLWLHFAIHFAPSDIVACLACCGVPALRSTPCPVPLLLRLPMPPQLHLPRALILRPSPTHR